MPKRPQRLCVTCKKLHRNAGSHCDEHTVKANWSKWRAKKGTTTQRGYGWEWEKLKPQVKLRDKNLCQPCFRKGRLVEAVAVDHIKPKSQGGSDSLTNL